MKILNSSVLSIGPVLYLFGSENVQILVYFADYNSSGILGHLIFILNTLSDSFVMHT